MKNSYKISKIIGLVIVAIQLLSCLFFAIIYLNNFFDVRNNIDPSIFYLILCIFVFIDLIFIGVVIGIASKYRMSTNLRAADLIGEDVQEAYNFGLIGLVAVNENNVVIWVSEFFKDKQIDILDTNILEWQPKLLELQGENSSSVTCSLEINSRNYEVKHLVDAGLYIFKDTTDYTTIYDYSIKQAVVIGMIMIDNFSDLSGSADDANDVISKVRNAIFEYARDFGVLIKRYKNDGYFMTCNYESLKKMEDDKFSLLEKIHIIGEKEDTPPTLSIGIAHDFPDVVKLNEMASSAIDIAMSRGGDQVVVSRYGQELVFYGGKSEAQENRNQVKVRVLADSVLTLIKNSDNIIIMGHTITDMDAIGACLGMRAICTYCNKPSCIVYDPKLAERKARGAINVTFTREQINEMMVDPDDAIDKVGTNTLVIVCDVHRPSLVLAPKLLEASAKVMVIDHHRRSEEFIESPVFSYIEPSASSSCELVGELIKYSSVNPQISIPSDYATIMLSGIFMDSNFFKVKTCGIRTFEASMILKEHGADNAMADDFLKDEFEEYALITKIISSLKTPYYGVVYCIADNDDIIESATLAKVANQCLQMKGVNACFVIGKVGVNEVKISGRSDGSINVQLIAEKLNGGGHFTMAASSFKDVDIATIETKLLDTLSLYLNDARAVVERK